MVTQGVNVKASTLQGPGETQIHLYRDSSSPLAMGKNVVADFTHTEKLTQAIYTKRVNSFSPRTHTYTTQHGAGESTTQMRSFFSQT